MKSIVFVCITVLVALLTAASYGQSQNPPRVDPRSHPEEKSEAAADAIKRAGDAAKEAIGMGNSITGCLKQGDESDPYVLIDSDTGKSVTVIGLGELAEHVNHTVKLEGSWKAGGEVYQATGIELASPSCEAPSSAGQTSGGGWPRTEGITADQQGQSPADRNTTQDIRRAVVADKSLSTYARNVKIITRDGVVTLKGAVRSEQERASIESLARAAAGANRINNELIIEPGDPRPKGERRP